MPHQTTRFEQRAIRRNKRQPRARPLTVDLPKRMGLLARLAYAIRLGCHMALLAFRQSAR